MPCMGSSDDADKRHVEVMLCAACRYLSKEQIESLRGIGTCSRNGIDWYINHLERDLIKTEVWLREESEECQEREYELKRLDLLRYEIDRMGYEIHGYYMSKYLKKKEDK